MVAGLLAIVARRGSRSTTERTATSSSSSRTAGGPTSWRTSSTTSFASYDMLIAWLVIVKFNYEPRQPPRTQSDSRLPGTTHYQAQAQFRRAEPSPARPRVQELPQTHRSNRFRNHRRALVPGGVQPALFAADREADIGANARAVQAVGDAAAERAATDADFESAAEPERGRANSKGSVCSPVLR